MRFHILFTLLFVSMSVASIVNNNTKISLLPYCAMRSAAIKIGQAVSPSLSAYTVCERDRLACYGVGSIRDYPLPATQTKCDSAFAACIMIEIAPLPIHTKLRVCLSVFWALRTGDRLDGEQVVCGDKAALCEVSLGVALSFRLLALDMASAKFHDFFVHE
jgi:hypothetical protein